MLEPLGDDPIEKFRSLWLSVKEAEFEKGTGATLATATKSGTPSARYVLFKEIEKESIQFFTNYESRKAQELLENPRASMVVYWTTVDLQVRFDGVVEKLSSQESDKYFEGRARASQLGAWASAQSQPLESREQLEAAYQKYEEQFEGGSIPRPDHWGGFRLIPNQIQFLHRKAGRLHDSFVFEKNDDAWTVQRLAP